MGFLVEEVGAVLSADIKFHGYFSGISRIPQREVTNGASTVDLALSVVDRMPLAGHGLRCHLLTSDTALGLAVRIWAALEVGLVLFLSASYHVAARFRMPFKDFPYPFVR